MKRENRHFSLSLQHVHHQLLRERFFFGLIQFFFASQNIELKINRSFNRRERLDLRISVDLIVEMRSRGWAGMEVERVLDGPRIGK